MANPINPALLGIRCDWETEDSACQRTATTTFVIPDSDSVDAITFFCDEHTAAFEAPDNAPFNQDWIRLA